MTYEEWKEAVAQCADKLLSLTDLWSEDDPYDLFEVAQESYDNGQTPEAFIRWIFEEDLASKAYHSYLTKESLKSNG